MSDNRHKELVNRIIAMYIAVYLPVKEEERVQTWLTDGTYAEEKDSALWSLWNEIDPDSAGEEYSVLCSVKKEIGLDTPDGIYTYKSLWFKVAAVLVLTLLIAGVWACYCLTK